MHRDRARGHRSPQLTYAIIALGAAAVVSVVLYLWLGWNLYWLWFLVINVVAFVFYRYDKRQAQHEGRLARPRSCPSAVALLGGFIGAGIGMYMRPRHKVHKPKFVALLVVGALIQATLLYPLYLR